MAKLKQKPNMEIGHRLRELMKKNNYTQMTIAERARISQTTVGRILRGEVDPSVENLCRIADALNTTIGHLISGEDVSQEGSEKITFPYKPVLVWDTPEELPQGEFVLVPRLDVKAAAGDGYENSDWPEEREKIAYRTDFIRSSLARTTKLIMITVSGDSMAPTLRHGDDVLVDMGQLEVTSGKIFSFVHGGEVRVKRLYMRKGLLLIHSDNESNPAYRYDEEIPDSEIETVKIIGRVVSYSGSCGL